MAACMYAPGTWGDCLDLTCSRQGGRCEFVGGTWGQESCRCVAVLPSLNRASQGLADMETPLETYRRIVDVQPACDAAYFSGAIARYRAGDERAAREISGRCLRFALAVAEEHLKGAPSPPLL